MDIYCIFDGVIANLENVDKALQEIQYGAAATQFSHKMVKVIVSMVALNFDLFI
jgi:hypothetical protein